MGVDGGCMIIIGVVWLVQSLASLKILVSLSVAKGTTSSRFQKVCRVVGMDRIYFQLSCFNML